MAWPHRMTSKQKPEETIARRPSILIGGISKMPRSSPVEDDSSKGDVPIRFRSQRIPLNPISLAFFDCSMTHLSALVRCELEQVSLDEKPSYAAISCCRESLLE